MMPDPARIAVLAAEMELAAGVYRDRHEQLRQIRRWNPALPLSVRRHAEALVEIAELMRVVARSDRVQAVLREEWI